MVAQLTTNTGPSPEDTETVTITRFVLGGPDMLSKTVSTIYAGIGDFQYLTGDTFIDAGGAVDQADALLVIDPIAGALPSVAIGDVVSVANVVGEFSVVLVETWLYAPMHLEVHLKRGNLGYKAGPS